MQDNVVLSSLIEAKKKGKKLLFLLIDPDDFDEKRFNFSLLEQIDVLLVGGSLISSGNLNSCINFFKSNIAIPVVIFPGAPSHISANADAILLLSLISGRNADLLIGNHVSAAFALKKSNIELIPTGYLIVDGGKPTTVSYISNTQPIPSDKPMIAAATALAGEQLGLKVIYLDAGSGAWHCVSENMIKSLEKTVLLPIIVGGGIRTKDDAINSWRAGATAIVVGNAAEKNPQIIEEINQEKIKLNFELTEKI